VILFLGKMSIYIRIFGGLYESVRVTVWIMSCSQVGWSKQSCWVYGYKVECDFVEDGACSYSPFR